MPLQVMLPRFRVASTEPERALGGAKVLMTLVTTRVASGDVRARREARTQCDRGPEAGGHCLEGH
jgi:hypothetical protein